MDNRMNLTDEENDLYTKLFVKCDLDGFGYVSGNTTCDLFRKSGLSDDVLFSIWEIADKTNSGQLDFTSFCVCLRLIGHVQIYGPHALRDSDVLVNKTPEELPVFSCSLNNDYVAYNSNNYEVDPLLYVISSADIDGYRFTFLQLTPDVNDYLLGDDARGFYFNTTNLSQDELMHLWTLSDVDKDGRLSFREFCVMQKLCECMKMYSSMPSVLPEPLLEFLETGHSGHFDHSGEELGQSYVPPHQSGKVQHVYPQQNVDHVYVDPDSAYLSGGMDPNVQVKNVTSNMNEKGVRNDVFVGEPKSFSGESKLYGVDRKVDTSSKTPPRITNELILQCENLLNTLRDALNCEKSSLTTGNRELAEMESKLKSDSKTLENLLTEYRSVVGDNQNVSKRRSLLNNKLSIIQDQIQELRDQIQSIRVTNVALSSNIDKNNEEQSLLQNTRQMFLKQLEEDNNLLKVEERELGEMSNTLQQLKRQRDLLNEKNVQLKECLSQSENATKTMLRSIQLQQGKILSVRNERINLLEEKLKLTNEINKLNNSDNNLNSSSQNFTGLFKENDNELSSRGNVNKNVNFDKKGIRVSSSSVKVGEDFPK